MQVYSGTGHIPLAAFNKSFLEYDEKNDVTTYQLNVYFMGDRNGVFAPDEYLFVLDNNCEYLLHADRKKSLTHRVDFDEGLCRRGLKIHSDNFTFAQVEVMICRSAFSLS